MKRKMKHKVHFCIVSAIKAGRLREPFSSTDFLNACPDGEGTYIAFLHKHALGNKGKDTELFVRVSPGKFECVRPFKYGGK
jgi:hypothetical protein